jgi:hypothetical protein
MSAILNFGKINSAQRLRDAAAHILRLIFRELERGSHIDSERTHQNVVLHGASEIAGITAAATARMMGAGIDPKALRRDAVRAVELMVSVERTAAIDHIAFFSACVAWAGKHCGGTENVLSCVAHFDEAQPHAHILIVPIIGGRMNGSDLVGGRAKLAEWRRLFFEEVAKAFGLKRAETAMPVYQRRALAGTVIDHLNRANDPALRSAVWQPLRDCIVREPVFFSHALGIERPTAPAKPAKSFVEIMTAVGRKTSEDTCKLANPLGFDVPKAPQSLPCVGFDFSHTVSTTQIPPVRTRRYLLAESLA